MAKAPKEVIETAQIVFAFNSSAPSLVIRYVMVERAKAHFGLAVKAFHARDRNYPIKGDTFESIIDLTQVITISFVEHSKREGLILI